MSYASNKGAAKLGAVISERIQALNSLNAAPLDFGVIQADYSLKLNGFDKPIPKGAYSVCRTVRGALIPGKRVLAAWVGNEAIIIDIVLKS